MPCVQYKIWKPADKKRALSCVALKKKGAKIRASSLILGSFRARRRPRQKRRLAKREKTEEGIEASYSLRENWRIREAFGTGYAFIYFVFRWRKGSTNPFGASENPKTKSFYLIHR